MRLVANEPMKPPKWTARLIDGTYVPEHEWDCLLIGYETWHETGARFGVGKGQSPDAQNWGVTIPSVALALRRHDEAWNGGKAAPRTREAYWGGVIAAACAAMCRMRRRRAEALADAAEALGLPDAAAKRRKAEVYASIDAATKCPKYYVARRDILK